MPATSTTWRPGASGNPAGMTRRRAEILRNLALAIREYHKPDEAYWWLRLVAAGVDPDHVDDGVPMWKRAAAAGAVVRPSAGGYIAPDWQHRNAAMKMIHERGWGQPAQHVVLEAEVRASQAHARDSGDDEMRELNDAQLEALAVLDRARRALGNRQEALDVASEEVSDG